MRILVFHGYLLSGTGSNIYTANLVRALVSLGHEVHLFCQDRDAEDRDFVNTVGAVVGQDIELRQVRKHVSEGSCTVYRPDIGSVLPVYVADTYEGFEAKTFELLSQEELDHYLKKNIECVAAVVKEVNPDATLANHLVMGPVIMARALAGRVPYVVKIHGSALEYTVAPNPRFLPEAREGLRDARTILVGSDHIGDRLIEVMGDPSLSGRIGLGPPGVDTDLFRLKDEDEKQRDLSRLLKTLPIQGIDPGSDRLVVYVGKLIVSKGVELLLAAWPFVLARHERAKLLIVGFGRYREALEQMVAALRTGDRAQLERTAKLGRQLEGGDAGKLTYLSSFLASLHGEDEKSYFDLCSRLSNENVVFLGRMDHHQLSALLPACETMAVPSSFPEAFGMVAAEAAACGVWPVVANHSGLSEVSDHLATVVPEDRKKLLSFDLGENAIHDLAEGISDWMDLSVKERSKLGALVGNEAERLWSWEGVARNVINAAEGKIDRYR